MGRIFGFGKLELYELPKLCDFIRLIATDKRNKRKHELDDEGNVKRKISRFKFGSFFL